MGSSQGDGTIKKCVAGTAGAYATNQDVSINCGFKPKNLFLFASTDPDKYIADHMAGSFYFDSFDSSKAVFGTADTNMTAYNLSNSITLAHRIKSIDSNGFTFRASAGRYYTFFAVE